MTKRIKPVVTTILYPRWVTFSWDVIEGDTCPMARSQTEGRAKREILLADGLCDGCKYFVDKGFRSLFGGFNCSHPQAKSTFFDRLEEVKHGLV